MKVFFTSVNLLSVRANHPEPPEAADPTDPEDVDNGCESVCDELLPTCDAPRVAEVVRMPSDILCFEVCGEVALAAAVGCSARAFRTVSWCSSSC